MLRFCSANSNCFSKDAFVNAPSVKFADFSDVCVNSDAAHTHNDTVCTSAVSGAFMNIFAMTGIAAAVSVFLFYIISIIINGIIICHASAIISTIIISMIIIFAIDIIINYFRLNSNINISAKLC